MKIFLDTVGCRLNQAEIESFANQFRAAGHNVIADPSRAELAVVNTCMVTAEAAADSRAAIRRAKRLGAKAVIVTGCWASLEPKMAASLPGVTRVVPNLEKESLVPDLLCLPGEFIDRTDISRMPVPGSRTRTRAFIKIQEGCNNACTYCITSVARGKSRSRSFKDILMDIQAALRGGVQEIVLTGVHLGAWGRDLDHPRQLRDLMSCLLSMASIPRLRLSSLEPWDLDPCFFDLWLDSHLCPHLHLPLQSGSESVLRRMSRKASPATFKNIMDTAHRTIPEVAITTDLISGFPGETEQEFQDSLEFVRSAGFSGGHVFTYSPRPGTPAASMKDQVPRALAKVRSAILREVLAETAGQYRRKFLGQENTVLWEVCKREHNQDWMLEGLTPNGLRVCAFSAEAGHWNKIDRVRLLQENGDLLQAEIIPM